MILYLMRLQLEHNSLFKVCDCCISIIERVDQKRLCSGTKGLIKRQDYTYMLHVGRVIMEKDIGK